MTSDKQASRSRSSLFFSIRDQRNTRSVLALHPNPTCSGQRLANKRSLQQLCSSSNGLGTIISYRTGTSCRICEFSPRSACHTKTSNRSVLRRIPANMLRVQWCSFPLSVPALLGFSFLMSSALAGKPFRLKSRSRCALETVSHFQNFTKIY